MGMGAIFMIIDLNKTLNESNIWYEGQQSWSVNKSRNDNS